MKNKNWITLLSNSQRNRATEKWEYHRKYHFQIGNLWFGNRRNVKKWNRCADRSVRCQKMIHWVILPDEGNCRKYQKRGQEFKEEKEERFIPKRRVYLVLVEWGKVFWSECYLKKSLSGTSIGLESAFSADAIADGEKRMKNSLFGNYQQISRLLNLSRLVLKQQLNRPEPVEDAWRQTRALLGGSCRYWNKFVIIIKNEVIKSCSFITNDIQHL